MLGVWLWPVRPVAAFARALPASASLRSPSQSCQVSEGVRVQHSALASSQRGVPTCPVGTGAAERKRLLPPPHCAAPAKAAWPTNETENAGGRVLWRAPHCLGFSPAPALSLAGWPLAAKHPSLHALAVQCCIAYCRSRHAVLSVVAHLAGQGLSKPSLEACKQDSVLPVACLRCMLLQLDCPAAH